VRRAAVLCLSALSVVGCGEGRDTVEEGPLGPRAKLQTATCRDWRAAPGEQRTITVNRLEEVAAGPRAEGGTLRDEIALRTLDARCKPKFARGFLLYELYNRAAGFRSLSDPAE
jgi:hypothetical protein